MGENKYSKIFEESGLSPVHIEALKLIGKDKTVLDVGCSTGYFIRAVREQLGGRVDGVEIDPTAAEEAAKYAREIYIGSIEDPDLFNQLHAAYDVVLLLDVLEHMREPWEVLKNVRRLLLENGCVIASIPNIANWRMRWSLFWGKFQYQETGLLDRDHIRFFTLKTVKQLFKGAGYNITYFNFTLGSAPLILKGSPKSTANFIKTIFRWIARLFPGLFANQFIIKVVKNNE